MTRHASPRTPFARRALVALATAGAALGAGTATAAAGPAAPAGAAPPPPAAADDRGAQTALSATTGTVRHAAGPVAALRPNPLGGTGVDPLANGVGTQVADFKPLSTRAVTDPVTQAPSVGGVPVAGRVAGLLGG
ncbi:hypothetical protein [Streptomyces leeuwenhoekii]|uniref:Secreted Protein n=1 Tax=Streptomyces leeuwenhoekii TaxID=1437453 RepID=A0A0F7VUT2_STRLW|nr:hypothetical protein [Streptomyces leeuwenhoekii]CQR62228.1 Conserved Hypothetical Protein [Streptomyces leeuwenhoekii]